MTDFGKFNFDDTDIAKRIHKICTFIQILILKHKPDKIVFEDIQMQAVANGVITFKVLAWLQGAIIETCYQHKLDYEIMTPSHWRAKCNLLKGYAKDRASQKRAAQAFVKKNFHQTCTQDEADAICIGYAATLNAGNEINWE